MSPKWGREMQQPFCGVIPRLISGAVEFVVARDRRGDVVTVLGAKLGGEDVARDDRGVESLGCVEFSPVLFGGGGLGSRYILYKLNLFWPPFALDEELPILLLHFKSRLPAGVLCVAMVGHGGDDAAARPAEQPGQAHRAVGRARDHPEGAPRLEQLRSVKYSVTLPADADLGLLSPDRT